MKKVLVGIALSTLASVSFAQIPVTDGAAIARHTASQVETIAKWKMQYDQMVSQIEQQKQQYQSVTGSRGLGKIMNDPALREYLPSDWQGVYDKVKEGGYSGLSGRGASVYAANRVFDSCTSAPNEEQRIACEARAVDAYDKAKSRVNQIDQLMAKINDTSDPKAIAELQGRIAAEQANIQNEQTKLQLYAMVAAAEDKVQAQRQREIESKTWASRKSIAVEPMRFNK
jgi:type IV secretion system protein VirB5